MNTESGVETVCRVCREPIKPGAEKCIHCSSSQGWQRHLGLTSSVLALLIALISVSQSAAPVLVRVYQGDRSHIALNLLKADGHTLRFVVSNTGNRPGSIAFGSMVLKAAGDEYSFPLEGDSAVGLIQGGAMSEIKLNLDATFDGQLASVADEVDGTTHRPANEIVVHRAMPAMILVDAIEFSGEHTRFRWPVDVLCGTECHLSTWQTKPVAKQPAAG
ncbi:hypothetical protein [Phenylobacterium aquaticum]|uniref:hypothetical protein n=1 Tax=Phenylobacterium aquaticum TaxID=1763816 RepID=UPI0026ED78FC|nr:hypothetical protein [Phenylobacterium aquaticum]